MEIRDCLEKAGFKVNRSAANYTLIFTTKDGEEWWLSKLKNDSIKDIRIGFLTLMRSEFRDSIAAEPDWDNKKIRQADRDYNEVRAAFQKALYLISKEYFFENPLSKTYSDDEYLDYISSLFLSFGWEYSSTGNDQITVMKRHDFWQADLVLRISIDKSCFSEFIVDSLKRVQQRDTTIKMFEHSLSDSNSHGTREWRVFITENKIKKNPNKDDIEKFTDEIISDSEAIIAVLNGKNVNSSKRTDVICGLKKDEWEAKIPEEYFKDLIQIICATEEISASYRDAPSFTIYTFHRVFYGSILCANIAINFDSDQSQIFKSLSHVFCKEQSNDYVISFLEKNRLYSKNTNDIDTEKKETILNAWQNLSDQFLLLSNKFHGNNSKP